MAPLSHLFCLLIYAECYSKEGLEADISQAHACFEAFTCLESHCLWEALLIMPSFSKICLFSKAQVWFLQPRVCGHFWEQF